jgi:DNA-binding MarR family transcriptional regulator
MKRRRTGSAEKGDIGPRGASSIAFLLAQVGAHAAAKFAERLAPLGLSPPHAGIMRALGAAEGLSQQSLSSMLGVVPSRLVTLVDELEGRGLVARRDDPTDRRAYALCLTQKGRQALNRVGRVAREHQDALCAALSGPEREQLASVLLRVADEQGLTRGVHPGFARLAGKRPIGE